MAIKARSFGQISVMGLAALFLASGFYWIGDALRQKPNQGVSRWRDYLPSNERLYYFVAQPN
jgi:hypothetical protein